MTTQTVPRVRNDEPSGPSPRRARNDPAQYDDLVDEWWHPHGAFAMLHWIAEARAALVPPAPGPGAVLVDIGCGGGLLAPHLMGKGYTHIGVDMTFSALRAARAHGVTVVQGDATALPVPDEIADVVVAGEVLEHVSDLGATVAEACRALKPGGTVVIDTIASTWLARLLVVTVAERVPGGAPPGLHDPALFVDRRRLLAEFSRHGVEMDLKGMRPSLPAFLAWAAKRREAARMVPTWSTSVLFAGRGTKAGR